MRTVRRWLRRLPRLRGRALWGRVRGRRALWRALRMCALRRLALCPLRLQLLGLRGTLLDMGSGLDIHLLTPQGEPSRKSTGETACPIPSACGRVGAGRSRFDMSGKSS